MEVLQYKIDKKLPLINKVSQRLLTLLDYQYKKIAIPTKEGYNMVSLTEIVYLKSCSNYTEIHFSNGQKVLTCKTLKYWQEKISHAFFIRCHSSYLANKNHLQSIDCKAGRFVTVNNLSIPISRSRKRECLDYFN